MRLLPVPRQSGFSLNGYFIWCGSLIKVGRVFHLFTSRWPEETGFPGGYLSHSEIVRAVSDNPLGPYAFQGVVLKGRGGAWWDGQMCHNPKIVRWSNTFILYYIGSAIGGRLRKIGYARATSIAGPWQRLEHPLPLGEDANNPAPYIQADGSILLAYRDRELRMHMAQASKFNDAYRGIAKNIFPEGRLEDPDLFFMDGRYHLVMEDNKGVLTGAVGHGGHLVSADGIHWQRYDPVEAYTRTIVWNDGSETIAERRERPELFNTDADGKGNGRPTHLITSVLIGGKTSCLIQPVAPL